MPVWFSRASTYSSSSPLRRAEQGSHTERCSMGASSGCSAASSGRPRWSSRSSMRRVGSCPCCCWEMMYCWNVMYYFIYSFIHSEELRNCSFLHVCFNTGEVGTRNQCPCICAIYLQSSLIRIMYVAAHHMKEGEDEQQHNITAPPKPFYIP